MREYRHKIKSHNLIFLYIITTIIITALAFSKYSSTVTGSNIAKIAVMANSISTDINIPMSSYPGGEPVICPIVITNKKDDKVCDVAQEFTFQIKNGNNIALNFGLYKDEYCTEIMEHDENGFYHSDEFKFSAGIEENKTYYLKVTWPENEKDASLAFEIEYFTVNIVSTQID